MRNVKIILIGMLSVLFATPALATGIRCGSQIINNGDPAGKLAHFCGQPVSKVSADSAGGNVKETWTYNFGPTNFLYTIRIVNGTIVQIDSGDRGY